MAAAVSEKKNQIIISKKGYRKVLLTKIMRVTHVQHMQSVSDSLFQMRDRFFYDKLFF